MSRTATEDQVIQLRRSQRSKMILVPRIEKFMQKPVDVEDDADKEFMAKLIEARSKPRKAGIYSPSMLASCVRQVYFYKTGVERKPSFRLESNGIFADGNFRHFKWQFIVWKMHRAGILQLVDVGSVALGSEVWVQNKNGDFGGTLDQIIYIPDIDFLFSVDYKGMNGNGFARALAKGPSLGYVVQSVGYAGLANESLSLPKKIKRVLIVGENKQGAVNNRGIKSPLGLYEWQYAVDDYNSLVAARVKKLRAYERRGEVPPPECTSTGRLMFKDCVFSPICRGEIEALERKALKGKKAKPKNKPKVQITRGR